MFHKMSTVMEVVEVAQNLQTGCLPAELKKKKAWKKQVSHELLCSSLCVYVRACVHVCMHV